MSAIAPMLCHDAKGHLGAVAREGWVMEPKLDGVRWQTWIASHDGRGGSEIRHWIGRNGNRATTTPEINAALAKLPADTVLDGELVTAGEWGDRAGGQPKQLVVFDVLRLAGHDTTMLPWMHRRELLERIYSATAAPHVLLTVVAPVDEATLEKWLELGFEGAVAKREGSVYRPGKRSRDWVKIKPQATAEALVIGWEHGRGKSNGELCGALQIRMLDTDAETTTGYGATPAEAEAMVGRIIEVRHHGISSKTGKPRHPIFARLRPDLEGAE